MPGMRVERSLVSMVVLAFVALTVPSVVLADGRVALVIGNGAYTGTSPLTNPVNDATDMAAALRELRFDSVVLETDADEDAMDDALADFEEQSAGADLALVFYAGHGMEMNGANYLVPVDARLATAAAVARETIALDSVLAATSGATTRIVILDACRNNPFARSMRGAVRANVRSGGLAAVSTGEGLLVAYAAAAGDVAADGEGTRNSPYTAALLKHLRSPGVEVRVMFGNVGGAVNDSTGADQQPFVYTSLTGEHYLTGRTTVVDDSSLRQQETVFWQSIMNSTNPADFEALLEAFPNGTFARLARNRLAELDRTDVDVTQLDIGQLRRLAEQGNVAGQTELGERYEDGSGVAQDYGVAVSWFRRAADQGYTPAQAALGFMYSNGRGVARDEQEAVRWYRRAVEQGNARAQNNLGFAYNRGFGVAQDDDEAVRWYRRAAEQGYAPGQDNLGFMYSRGRGVAQDDEEAVRWYRRAAEQGHANGQVSLGFMYSRGRGVAQDDEEAVRWYRRAAEQGHARGQSNLGFMYYNGRGVSQDDEEAVRWYRRAAEQGHARGQNRLGVMYERGRGVPQDIEEAVRWYQRAAEQGDRPAQRNLDRLRR